MFIVILLLSHLVSWDRCGTDLIVSITDPCCLSYFNSFNEVQGQYKVVLPLFCGAYMYAALANYFNANFLV